MKNNTGKKNEKNSFVTNVPVQDTSLQLFNMHHQINLAVQMNVCTR